MRMRARFMVMISVFTLVYGSINWYVGVRGYQFTSVLYPGLSGWLFGLIFALIALSFISSRFMGKFIPRPVVNLLTVVGAYWLAIMQFALFIVITIDVLRLFNSWFGLLPNGTNNEAIVGFAALLLLAGIVIYGLVNARNPIVKRYEITIPKQAGKHQELHIVLVSDTHLGAINGVQRLEHMVRMVNSLNPDVILLAGDVMDDDINPFIKQGMPEKLAKLNAGLGVYSVLGNHEYISGSVGTYKKYMEQAGIPVLVDSYVFVDDSFYIIGRDDLSGKSFNGKKRMEMEKLLEGANPSLPLILMDHQPYKLESAQQAGVDLQVSGHTHRGQMFPYHYITRRTYEIDWGYLLKGSMHVVVSLGFGTWGPPIRVGNRPEVVSIRVKFKG